MTFYCCRIINSAQQRCLRVKFHQPVRVAEEVSTLRERTTAWRYTMLPFCLSLILFSEVCGDMNLVPFWHVLLIRQVYRRYNSIKHLLGSNPRQNTNYVIVTVAFPRSSPVNAVWRQLKCDDTDFVFRRNGRVHLNRRGRQFSRLLAAEACASAVVMVYTSCSEVVWRVLATHSIRQFPLHFPSRVSPCAITFQLESKPHWPGQERFHQRHFKSTIPELRSSWSLRSNIVVK